MNLQYIRDNFRTFRPADVSSWWRGPLSSCLKALYSRAVQTDWDSDDLGKVANTKPIEVFTIFDLYLGCEHRADLHVVAFEGAPIAVVYCTGRFDDYEYAIIDIDAYRKLGRELAAYVADQLLAKEYETKGDSEQHLKETPLAFVDSKRTAFMIDDPRGGFPGEDIWKYHRAFYPQDDGALTPVTRFVGVAHKGHILGTDPRVNQVLVLINGEQVEIDGRRLVFELEPGKIDEDGVRTSFLSPGEWVVKVKYDHAPVAFILSRVPLAWHVVSITLQFHSAAELNRFIARYPVDEVQKGEHFSVEKLDYKVVVSDIT